MGTSKAELWRFLKVKQDMTDRLHETHGDGSFSRKTHTYRPTLFPLDRVMLLMLIVLIPNSESYYRGKVTDKRSDFKH